MKAQSFRNYPIALFSSVMGFAAVTIAVKQIENTYEMNHILSSLLLGISSVWFVFNITILLFRMIRYQDDIVKEFNHPITMNFFAAISISLLLLATGFYSVSINFSWVLWFIGIILQMTLTIIFLHKLMWNTSLNITHFTPISFLPIVGNLVVPIAGSFHVPIYINWVFFGFGILFSIIYMTFIFNRLLFQSALPNELLPTLFILLAPSSVGFVAYFHMIGELDIFSHMMYGMSFFIGLFLLLQLKEIFKFPFGIPTWALLFPSSAFTIATIIMYRETGLQIYEWIYVVQLVGLTLLVGYLTWHTIRFLRRNLF